MILTLTQGWTLGMSLTLITDLTPRGQVKMLQRMTNV